MRLIRLASFLIAIALGLNVFARAADAAQFNFSLPLDQGKLRLRDVLARIGEGCGVKVDGMVKDFDWTIDVHSALGKVQLNLFDRVAGQAISTRIEGETVQVTVDQDELKKKLAEGGRTVENWIGELSGQMTKRQERAYGITFVTSANERAKVSELDKAPARVVLLVHGLDDPGFMWRDLIPELHQRGYDVARFEYPNDGPIVESADLLASCLKELHQAGVQRIDIIAHSMGGLVSRDVLTRPAYYAGDGSGSVDKQLPPVDRLIMLGTPNHGSKFARLRGLAELREHFYRAWHGEQGWLSGFDADGTGEAGVDLLPESDFLRRLNSRKLASHTKHTVVAGQCGTELADDLRKAVSQARKFADSAAAPDWLRDMLAKDNEEIAIAMVGETVNELGDGCVAVESARLEGVDDCHVVAGNHLSIVVNVLGTTRDEKMPPAIPIILERLDPGHND